MFLRHLVPWPSVDIHGKFYGDRPRETPPSRKGFKTEGVSLAKYSDFSERERDVRNMSSPVPLSSLCNVRVPYSGDCNFRQCFSHLVPWPSLTFR